MNRRTALQAFLAGLAAPLAWVRPAKAESCTITVPVTMDREFFKRQLMAARDPDYIPEPQGIVGETYFKCGVKPDFGSRRLYFNGVDVTERSNECDAVGGWVRMFDVDATGKVVRGGHVRTHYGTVEFRPVGGIKVDWSGVDFSNMEHATRTAIVTGI